MLEPAPHARQPIQIGRADHRVAGTTEAVESELVGEDKQDVDRPVGLSSFHLKGTFQRGCRIPWTQWAGLSALWQLLSNVVHALVPFAAPAERL